MGDRYVITAAHCTTGEHPDTITVLIGATKLGVANDNTQFIRNISEIRQHPNFVHSETGSNDIAVLVLHTPVDLFTYPNIKPVCLPTAETRKGMYGRDAVVSGWGYMGENLPAHSHLQEVKVKILPNCGNIEG